jgi:hypothetical protein
MTEPFAQILFVGLPVTDLDASIAWSEKLFGHPADVIVHDDEVMWQVGATSWIYVVRDPRRAGNGLAMLAVADLDTTLAGIARRGLAPGSVEVVAGADTKASFFDPDANTVAIAQLTP